LKLQTKYNKKYATTTENLLRATIFTDNQNFIDSHNRRFAARLVTYDLAMNKFGDLLPTEFALTQPGFRINPLYPPRKNFTFFTSTLPQAPNSVDWLALGAVTPVKNEQQCSASYAFAATGALEGQVFRKLDQLSVLSEQNLIDCTQSGTYYNKGCAGGTMTAAFQYVRVSKVPKNLSDNSKI
jgi:Papain family cysteine protease/Cathepsin propeptide inhibitor domain (I29)